MRLPTLRQGQRPRSGFPRTRRPRPFRLAVEELECRYLPAPMTFMATTTADSGSGSLRQAILDANANTGNGRAACPVCRSVLHIQVWIDEVRERLTKHIGRLRREPTGHRRFGNRPGARLRPGQVPMFSG
jgi:hypothetical protein